MHLKGVYEAFGGDKRFAMIGLSVDFDRSITKKYVVENERNWIQGFLGGWSKAIGSLYAYGVRHPPAIFLIDPDGKIIAKDLEGDAIKMTVAKVLRQR